MKQAKKPKVDGLGPDAQTAAGRKTPTTVDLMTSHPGAILTPAERQRLHAAFTPDRGLKPGGLIALAENPLERALATVLLRLNPRLLLAYREVVSALFLFRAIMVPQLCQFILDQAGRAYAGRQLPIWLFEYSAYAVAYKRAQCEILLLIVTRDGGRPGEPAGNFGQWLSTPGGKLYRLRRFDQWRRAALRSARYWLGKQSRRLGALDPREREAAMLGVFQGLSGAELPDLLFKDVLNAVLLEPKLTGIFRNAHRRSSRLSSLGLNCWLQEAWPIVEHYHWTFHDLQQLLGAKSQVDGSDDSDDKRIDTAAQVSERCKKLGLYLSPAAQARVGKPRRDTGLPHMAGLGVALDSISENASDWIAGDPDDLQRASEIEPAQDGAGLSTFDPH